MSAVTMVRHPDDPARWGVFVSEETLVSLGIESCSCGLIVEVATSGNSVREGGYPEERCQCVWTDENERGWKKLIKLLRAHEFNVDRPHESRAPKGGGLAFFYLALATDEGRRQG